MDINWIEVVSIVSAALAVAFGALGPALGEGRAVASAMDALARQPEASATISRTLFVGLAMIETTAIYAKADRDTLRLIARPWPEGVQ